jgi:uncharacterized membrane protein
MSYFESSPALFAFLATIVAIIFWLGRQPKLQWFFRYFPPLIWTYFVPMILSSLGILPSSSALYGFVMLTILPAVIVLLLVPSDTASIARAGPKAIAMMLVGTTGIVLGAAVSFGLFLTLLPEGTLPDDAWRGVASLSGSWIGGSPNMAAIAASLGVHESTLFGKMVIVDTICAYTWLGVLIALVSWQTRIDRFNRADSRLVGELAARLTQQQAGRSRPVATGDFLAILAVGFLVSQACLLVGGWMSGVVKGAEAAGGLMATINLSQVLSAFGWGILFTTFASIALSFTPLRRIEDTGASSIGNAGLYLLLTTFGAQADLRLIGPGDLWLIAIGVVWLLIHILVLFIGARLLRAPLFLTAIASMANIGGTASAPVVAAAFHPSLAPVGLLLAILGGIIGTPVGLLIIGKLCAAIAGQ